MTAVAVEKNLKSAHMTERLSLIKSMAKQCKVPEFVPARLLFKENSVWLMLMITFVNGARTQSCELLKEEDMRTSRRATKNDLDKVELDINYLKQKDVQAIEVEGRKTGLISLIVPKRLYNAMLEISINKKHVWGRAEPGTLFFTNMDGNAILLKAAYSSLIALEVFKIMGIKRLTVTMARATATRLANLNLKKSEPTGMSQNKDTQVTIYNETTEEQGIKNKLSANATIFSCEAELDIEQTHPEEQPPKRYWWRSNSRLISIYNLDSLEWSCLFLAGDMQPSSLDRVAKYLERYLYSANRNIMRIRKHSCITGLVY